MRKTLILCLLSVSLISSKHAAGAAETSELSVMKTEVTDPVTGLKRSVMEDYSRDGVLVVRVISLYRQGKLASTSRFIYANGRSITQEVDEDADGFFELIVITPSEDPNTIEAFLAGKDGSLKPAPITKLKEIRLGYVKLQAAGTMMRKEIEQAEKPTQK